MRIGIVDLGTLSLRFDVFEIGGESPPRLVHRYRAMPRLGEEAYKGQAIGSAASERVINELRVVADRGEEWKVDRLIAVGTGILRTASDSRELLSEIRRQTGITLQVITGDREAELTALGILSNEEDLDGTIALIDIGGGSTEVSFCRKDALLSVTSLDLGVAKLLQIVAPAGKHPFPPETVSSFRDTAESAIRTAEISSANAPDHVLGSSGTIRALARLRTDDGNERQVLSRDHISSLLDEMVDAPREIAMQIPGMEERRVDLMVPGTVLLLAVLEALDAKAIRVTKFSLRHGLLAEAIRSSSLG